MKFKVKTEILRNQLALKPGAVVELDPAEAEAMPWAVEPLPEPPKPDAKDDKPKK